MLNNPLVLLGVCTFFAAIPVGIWLYILFNKNEKGKKIVALIFGIGCFTAPALLGLQYLWEKFPQFNLSAFIENTIQTQSTMYIFMFILFGAMEEIIKHYVVSAVDKKTLLITKVNDAIRYSFAAALGFSFTENIYYLYEFWPSISSGELVQMYIFRSIFTACAHMIFSGIFGYYYGIGKFSIQISKEEKAVGKTNRLNKIIANIFNISLSQAYQQKYVLKGLFLAIFTHATYNYLLQFNIILPVLLFVVAGFAYLKYLLSRKAGHLILVTDISEQKKSTVAKKDEEVVVDLLGMWFKEKKYVDVIHICERLLQRDPDNNVVKLFKAKAMDQMDLKNNYRKILGSIVKTDDDLSDQDKNVLSKYVAEKQELEKAKRKVDELLKKEGKLPKESPQKEQTQKPQEISKKDKENFLNKYTGEGTFDVKL